MFVVATLVYLIKKRKRTKILPLKTRLLPTFFWAVCNVSGSVLAYLAYQQIAANSVHVVRLFGVMITALLARFFLKEKLTRQQFLWIGIALTALITFTLAK
ncbi:MAG: EamA family transporter [bacterium]|nr:EamA family transporter [bacterium]